MGIILAPSAVQFSASAPPAISQAAVGTAVTAARSDHTHLGGLGLIADTTLTEAAASLTVSGLSEGEYFVKILGSSTTNTDYLALKWNDNHFSFSRFVQGGSGVGVLNPAALQLGAGHNSGTVLIHAEIHLTLRTGRKYATAHSGQDANNADFVTGHAMSTDTTTAPTSIKLVASSGNLASGLRLQLFRVTT